MRDKSLFATGNEYLLGMTDYAIIHNPTAAAGKTKKQFKIAIETLNNMQISYELHETEYEGHAIELARNLANEGMRIIGAGGDGTCNEVLNGVMAAKSKTLVGFIPMGTGNDIPGAIGYAPNVKRACEIIAQGKSGLADVGRATTKDGKVYYFLGIGSQGFDAEVTKRTNEGSKRLPGTWNYVASVVRTVFGFKKRKLRVTLDADVFEGYCNLVAVGNGPSYGGWMYMCPRATVNDGLFHVSIVQMGVVELLLKFNSMYSKTLHPDPHVTEYVSKTVKIEMVDQDSEPYIGQVDGEIIGDLPISYDCIPNGFEFIRPEQNEAHEWFMKKYGAKYLKHVRKLQAADVVYHFPA